jgi:hypothetical protein
MVNEEAVVMKSPLMGIISFLRLVMRITEVIEQKYSQLFIIARV